MYKVFLKYPESLRPAFPRLKEKLEDPDPGLLAGVKKGPVRGRDASSASVRLGGGVLGPGTLP